MLDADDMVNLAAEERVFFSDQAILAPVVCTSGN
jgi:hypothetical protein